MKQNIIFLLVIFSLACNRNVHPYQYVYRESPHNIVYDTIEDDFFYEYYIDSYNSGDVIVQNGGLVVGANSITYRNYLNGYYIIDLSYLISMADQNALVTFDSTSLHSLQMGLRSPFEFSDCPSCYNPFCNCYYKRVHLQAEVLYLDSISHRIPLFMDCDGYKKFEQENKGKDYEVARLPTFIVTRVFKFHEM